MGERGGQGDNDDDCGRGGRVVVVVIKQRGQSQGDDVNDDGGRGNRVFVVIVIIVVDFRGAKPTWR